MRAGSQVGKKSNIFLYCKQIQEYVRKILRFLPPSARFAHRSPLLRAFGACMGELIFRLYSRRERLRGAKDPHNGIISQAFERLLSRAAIHTTIYRPLLFHELLHLSLRYKWSFVLQSYLPTSGLTTAPHLGRFPPG
jgi:hypothetical protein